MNSYMNNSIICYSLHGPSVAYCKRSYPQCHMVRPSGIEPATFRSVAQHFNH